MKEDEKYESLKAKLRKLAALAERGVGGEAENARRLMEQICREHGVSIDEILIGDFRRNDSLSIRRDFLSVRVAQTEFPTGC